MDSAYGSVWASPVAHLATILKQKGVTEAALCEALEQGYFSQHTCWRNPAMNKKIVDWELLLIDENFKKVWEKVPANFGEICQVPRPSLVPGNGRILTPDLLRNLYYALEIEQQFSFGKEDFPILEIGSGSGGLARVLKDVLPGVPYWLLDIRESLTFAKIYLETTFPEKTFLWIEKEEDLFRAKGKDFVFVPLENAKIIAKETYSLAVNIFSFSEMPNPFIANYFSMIQKEADVKNIFLLNAFLHPVTPETRSRINQGDWLLHLNECWKIMEFQIQPKIHRNPYVKNFTSCILIAATKIKNEKEQLSLPQQNQEAFLNVLCQDWVAILTSSGHNKSRPEMGLEPVLGTPHLVENLKDLPRLLEITEYIGRFELGESKDSTLKDLWNYWRMEKSQSVAEVLLCFLAMINKSILGTRCSKEELQILSRYPGSKLNDHYASYLNK